LANTTRGIEELKTWRGNYDQLHKERLTELKANEARTDEKFKSVEADVRKLTSLTDNLNFRVTTNENATTRPSAGMHTAGPNSHYLLMFYWL
jgi:predicted nuclease with TOPRIM domain